MNRPAGIALSPRWMGLFIVKALTLCALTLILAAPVEARLRLPKFGGSKDAVIRGTIRLPGEPARPVSYGPAAPVRGANDAVIYLEEIPEKVESKETIRSGGGRPTIAISPCGSTAAL